MIVSRGETYRLELYSRLEDSPYEVSSSPDPTCFYGRPASQREVKNYRVQQGVGGNYEGVFVVCSNLPNSIKPNDKVKFMGKMYICMSIGYYYEESRIVNAKVLSDEYLIERCPKGLRLE